MDLSRLRAGMDRLAGAVKRTDTTTPLMWGEWAVVEDPNLPSVVLESDWQQTPRPVRNAAGQLAQYQRVYVLHQGPITTITAAPTSLDRYLNRDSNRITFGERSLENLPSNITVGTVVALGAGAMQNMTDVKKGIAIGNGAQGAGTKSRDNIAIGEDALHHVNSRSADYDQSQPEGTRNIALGGNAAYFINEGSHHVAIGRNSASCHVNGSGTTAVGSDAAAGYAPIGFSGVIENWAPMGSGGSVTGITAVGSSALSKISGGARNTAVGAYSGYNLTKGSNNIAVGFRAMRDAEKLRWYNGNEYVEDAIDAIYSWNGTQLTVTTATAHNIVAGNIALLRLLDGGGATFQNDVAPAQVQSADTLSFVVTVPDSGGVVHTGSALIVGHVTNTPATASDSNTVIGVESAVSATAISNTVTAGYAALASAIESQRNTAIGAEAMRFGSASTSDNTVVGYRAMRNANGVQASVAMGAGAGENLVTGDQNTFIGFGSGKFLLDGVTALTGLSNVTCIGYASRASGDDQVQLGDSRTTTYVYNTVQSRSDVRDKADIRDTELGLDFINAVRPVDFKWDLREDYVGEKDGSKVRTRFHHGVIAQEIKATGFDFGGLQDHSINGGGDVLTVGYDEFIGPLIKAVQQLSAENKSLADRVRKLENPEADGLKEHP